ncbi:MAG: zinc-ribbon domain-containing protein [Chloroflexota bacterium]
MKCNNCGAAVLPQDRFCGECGAPVPEVDYPPAWPKSVPAPTGGPFGPPVEAEPSAAPKRGRGRSSPRRSGSSTARRRLPVLTLALLGVGLVAVIGGVVAIGMGWVNVAGMLPYGATGEKPTPAGEVTLASFQAAARKCEPIAAVMGMHEGVDLDVLVTVQRQVRDTCQMRLEIVDDQTGQGLAGKHMTCGIPMQPLAEGTQPPGELAEYCSGPLLEAIQQLTQEGR